MDTITHRIILASSSPRRKMLLEQVGIPFEIMVSDIEEVVNPDLRPECVAEQLALQKAQAIASSVSEAIIIGADTIVVHDHSILGKPRDDANALRMLSRLSGQCHHVITGMALVSTYAPETRVTRHEKTQVKIAPLTEKDMAWYLQTREPLDKAGAYAIQGKGAMFVEWIHGCYNNVVGLPIFLLLRMLKQVIGME